MRIRVDSTIILNCNIALQESLGKFTCKDASGKPLLSCGYASFGVSLQFLSGISCDASEEVFVFHPADAGKGKQCAVLPIEPNAVGYTIGLGERDVKSMRKIVVGVLVLGLLIVTNPGKEAHWAECETVFEANAAKESRNAGWLEKFGFWLLKDSMKDSIHSALYVKSYGICSTGCLEGHIVTFGILGKVFFVAKD